MSLLRALFGPSKEEVWAQLAREVGGSMTGGIWTGSKVQAQSGDWIVTLDTYTQSSGKSSTTYTRIRAPFFNRDTFRFTIYRSGLFTDLGKHLFGMQDIEIGDPFFDEAFVVQGNNEQRVHALFANPRIRELIHAQPSIYLTIKREENWLWGPKYPEGVDVLYFQVVGVIKDLGVLKALYELYAEILNHVCHLDSGYQDDVALHIRALMTPGGRVVSDNAVMWDGDPPRREAAQALGRLKARPALPYLVETIQDQDPFLRANVAWALGEIGERAVAPSLLRLLGDQTPVGSRTVREFASESLHRLSEGGVVTAFDAALAGDRSALELLRKLRRPEINEALLQVLEASHLERAARAAWALGELGAVGALRRIEARSRELRRSATPQQLELFRQAAALLERHSELPRPASSPPPTGEHLPRPSGPAESA